jgi:hypothetical protein
MPEKTRRGVATTPGEVILDFSQVKPFEPLSSDVRYLVRVTKLNIDKSKAGNPKSHCELTIEGPEEVQVEEWEPNTAAPGGMSKVGPRVDDKGNPVTTRAKGRILFREFSLEPKALPFLYEFIKAVDPDAVLDESFRYNPNNYMGLTASCTINNEAFDEQIRARVRRMYPASAYKG